MPTLLQGLPLKDRGRDPTNCIVLLKGSWGTIQHGLFTAPLSVRGGGHRAQHLSPFPSPQDGSHPDTAWPQEHRICPPSPVRPCFCPKPRGDPHTWPQSGGGQASKSLQLSTHFSQRKRNALSSAGSPFCCFRPYPRLHRYASVSEQHLNALLFPSQP